ncbi:MAG: hypothetical protein HWD61_00790 [Parachlamydiaceae bacterium]|nr:MAG: hypothetical protein HWD61_00790 [Parachlamydiaceae bacterium]
MTKEPTALASLRNLKGFELAQQKANSRVSHRYSVVVVNEIDEWNKDEKFEQILKDVETVNFYWIILFLWKKRLRSFIYRMTMQKN